MLALMMFEYWTNTSTPSTTALYFSTLIIKILIKEMNLLVLFDVQVLVTKIVTAVRGCRHRKNQQKLILTSFLAQTLLCF